MDGHDAQPGAAEDLRKFRATPSLSDHWARLGGLSAPRTYYWYLTFEKSPHLADMARLCQESLRFPYYDLVVAEELHLTLDRIGDEDQLSPTQLSAIQENAHAMCEQVAPFSVAIGSLTGTAGAVGFSVSPREPIAALRDVLRSATLSGGENVRPKEGAFHAHVAIAYANAEVDPAAAIEAVVRLHSIPPVRVAVTQAQLVLLERQRGSYAWQPIAPVRLRGALGPELREDTGIYGDRPAHTSRVGDT